MAGFLQYVKSFVCDCGCAWTIEKQDPEVCWACNSHGPHTVMSTCAADPKHFAIMHDYSEDFLFSDIPDMEE